MSLSLNIIYNHRYECNVSHLNSIYASRFSYVNHLIPFARSNGSGVIRISENSVNFSSHVAQSYDRVAKEGVSHYVFVADDLFLNPVISESNLLELCGIEENEAYTKNLASLGDAYYLWTYSTGAVRAFRTPKFAYENELPKASAALEAYERLGIKTSTTSLRCLLHWNQKIALRDMLRSPRFVLETIQATLFQEPKYPLLCGYSDFFVVPARGFEKFAYLCGVFGALNLFAEVAIPTALALSCPTVRTEYLVGEVFAGCKPPSANPDVQWRGREFWDSDISAFEDRYGLSLTRLTHDFPDGCLYIHPVKLSKWK